jgi:hypothetical protein
MSIHPNGTRRFSSGFLPFVLGALAVSAATKMPAKVTGFVATILIAAAITVALYIPASSQFEFGMVSQISPATDRNVMVKIRIPFERKPRVILANRALLSRLNVRETSWLVARGQPATGIDAKYLEADDIFSVTLPFLSRQTIDLPPSTLSIPSLVWVILGGITLLIPGTVIALAVSLALALSTAALAWHGLGLLVLLDTVYLPLFTLPIFVGFSAIFGFYVGLGSMSYAIELLRRLVGASALFLISPMLAGMIGWPPSIIWGLVPLSLAVPITSPILIATVFFSKGLQADTPLGVYAILGTCTLVGIALNAASQSQGRVPKVLTKVR